MYIGLTAWKRPPAGSTKPITHRVFRELSGCVKKTMSTVEYFCAEVKRAREYSPTSLFAFMVLYIIKKEKSFSLGRNYVKFY
jgi:hypothetical protein